MGQVESRASAVYGIKNDISAAIENRGVSLSGVTFGGYAAKIGEIQGGVDPSSANAVASNVFSGKTFYAVDSNRHTGTMPLAAVNSGSAYTLLTSGYFSGGVVASYINPAEAEASEDAVRSGQTFFAVDSAIKTGTMPDSVVTSGATATVITSGYLPNAVTVTTGGGGEVWVPTVAEVDSARTQGTDLEPSLTYTAQHCGMLYAKLDGMLETVSGDITLIHITDSDGNPRNIDLSGGDDYDFGELSLFVPLFAGDVFYLDEYFVYGPFETISYKVVYYADNELPAIPAISADWTQRSARTEYVMERPGWLRLSGDVSLSPIILGRTVNTNTVHIVECYMFEVYSISPGLYTVYAPFAAGDTLYLDEDSPDMFLTCYVDGGGGGGTLGELVNVSELLGSGQAVNNNVIWGSGVLVKALSGATVCGNTVMPGVEVLVYSGAVETANATSGGVLLTPSDATYYGSMFTANRVVQSGESLFNCSCSACTVTAVSGATVYDHHAAGNGYLNVSSGALVKYVECLSSARLTVLQGGSVHSVGLSGNYCSLTVRSAGTATNVSATVDTGYCIVSSGGLLSGLYSDRQMWVRAQLYGGTVAGLQAISAEVKLMSSGSLLSGASCGQYYITATAGTTVTDVYASGGLAVSVLSGGSLCNASAVNAGLSCFAQVSSGGYYVSNVHFSNGYNYGFFNVSVMNSSCTILDATFGAITVSFSNGVLPASQTYKGEYMTWTIGGGVQTDGWFHSGYSMWMIVSSGGLAANHTVGYDAAFDISAGGSASGVVVSSGAWFRVFSGGKAWDVAVSNAYGQRTWVYASGSLFGATVESRADLRLSGFGAYCSRPVISSGGLLVVSSGAFAQDVVSMPGATVTSMTGATVTYST